MRYYDELASTDEVRDMLDANQLSPRFSEEEEES